VSNTDAYDIKENKLVIKSTGATISFSWPISKVLNINNIFVVLIDPLPDSCFNENVFGVSGSGCVIWTIEKRKHVYTDSPYTSIIENNGKVEAFNWDGDYLLIEPKDGRVLSTRYSK